MENYNRVKEDGKLLTGRNMIADSIAEKRECGKIRWFIQRDRFISF